MDPNYKKNKDNRTLPTKDLENATVRRDATSDNDGNWRQRRTTK